MNAQSTQTKMRSTHKTKIIGLPGTGKTTYLLGEIDRLLDYYRIDEIIYTSFVRATIQEMRKRVATKFHIPEQSCRYFKTLHAIAYELLEIDGTPPNWETKADFRHIESDFLEEFEEFVRTDYKLYNITIDTFGADPVSKEGMIEDPFNWLFAVRKMLFINLKDPSDPQSVMEMLDSYGLKRKELVSTLIIFNNKWERFLKSNSLFEFDGLLVDLLQREKVPVETKILFVDEFQDCNKLQNAIIELFAPMMDHVYVAGDHNQAIYGFTGASPEFLKDYTADNNVILNKSWRVPENVIRFIKTIYSQDNTVNSMKSRRDISGQVLRSTLADLDITELTGSTFVLCRTNSLVDWLITEFRRHNLYFDTESDVFVVYSFVYHLYNDLDLHFSLVNKLLHTKRKYHLFDSMTYGTLEQWVHDNNQDQANPHISSEAIKSITKRNLTEHSPSEILDYCRVLCSAEELSTYLELTSILIEPSQLSNQRMEFITIHAAKGREAENVILLDLIPSFMDFTTEELRILYVGMTRTRNRLVLLDMEKENYRNFVPL